MYLFLPDRLRKILQVAMDIALFGCAIVGFSCLMFDLGWNLSEDERFLALGITQFVLWLFVAQEAFRPLLAESLREYWRTRWLELLMALLFAAELVAVNCAGEFLLVKLARVFPGWDPLRVMLSVIAGVGIIGGVFYFVRSARTNQWLSLRRVSPSWALILGFSTLSGAGTLLLKMPNAQALPVSWIDCWFTATSASCITGLTSVDTAVAWTPFGQTIILVLMQLGGLGVMTFAYFISYFLSGGLSLRERVVLRDLLNEDNIGFIGQMLLMICGATFVIEAIGATWFYLSFDAPAFADRQLYYSVFHAVSAFCNAGFSLFGDAPTAGILQSSLSIQMCIMSMIVLGGIGFPTLRNLWQCSINAFRRRILRKEAPYFRLTINTKLVLWITGGLLVFGTLGFYLTRWLAHANGAAAPSWRISLFDAVTSRTAGFAMDNPALWSVPAALLCVFLMFIGGSPGGTAGGVRTTTFAVACANAWQVLREKPRMDVFNRSFPAALAQRAFAILLLSGLYVCLMSLVMIVLHPQLAPFDLFFETVSAFSTTGLSRSTSPLLSDSGKVLILFTMLVGRVGILLAAMAFVPKASSGRVLLPKGNILLS